MKKSHLIAGFLAVCSGGAMANACWAQSILDDGYYDGPQIDSVPLPPPPPPTPPPPPVIPPPPPVVILSLPPGVVRPPIVVPTDVTQANFSGLSVPLFFSNTALNGIMKINEKDFPKDGQKGDDGAGILVKWKPGTDYKKPAPTIVELVHGEILVSVRSPAKMAMIHTNFGAIALATNSDVIVELKDGVLRIKNIDGMGMKVMVKLNQGPFAGKVAAVSVAPGYELTASETRLTALLLRPRDGIARRYMKVLEEGYLAISEFSVASAMEQCSSVLQLRQSVGGLKERRIVSDMTKMAAVLNHKMGTQGFTGFMPENNSQLAGNSSTTSL
jgi:hypothetical protein